MLEIWKHFISSTALDDQKRLAYLSWFVFQFPRQEFSDTDYYMYEYAKFSDSLGVVFRAEYLDVFIATELREIMKKSNVKVAGTEQYTFEEATAFETAYNITGQVLKTCFDNISSLETNIDDFKVDIVSFCSERLSNRYLEVLTKNYQMAQESYDVYNSIDNTVEELEILRSIYDKDALFEFMEDLSQENQNADMEFIVDTGIAGFDKYITSFKASQLVALAAPTGFGKTRFSTGVLLYRAVTKYKRDCCYYVLEQKKIEIEAILISVHIVHLFGIVVSDSLIVENNVPEELQDKVEAARIDLFESGKYGKCIVYEADLEEDTFIHRLKIHDKLQGPFDAIFIDYMSLIEASDRRRACSSPLQIFSPKRSCRTAAVL